MRRVLPVIKENARLFNSREVHFSASLELRFQDLRRRFDSLLAQNVKIPHFARKVFHLPDGAERIYFHVFAFDSFIDETFDNADDPRFHALWALFRDLSQDPELLKAGQVIWSKDKKLRDRVFDNPFERYGRELDGGSWACMPREKRHNIRRSTLIRFLALVGNDALRKR